MTKYVKVIDGLKSNANGFEYKLDEVNISDHWNPEANTPEEMGGFNFSTEDKILRYIFRGDTIYDVIIPEDAEVIKCESKNVPNGIFRSNKIIVTNPKKITEDMVIELYKKSTLPDNTYYQCLVCLLYKEHIDTVKYIIKDRINKDNVDDAICGFEDYVFNGKENFDYDKLWDQAKEVYDILKNIQKQK